MDWTPSADMYSALLALIQPVPDHALEYKEKRDENKS